MQFCIAVGIVSTLSTSVLLLYIFLVVPISVTRYIEVGMVSRTYRAETTSSRTSNTMSAQSRGMSSKTNSWCSFTWAMEARQSLKDSRSWKSAHDRCVINEDGWGGGRVLSDMVRRVKVNSRGFGFCEVRKGSSWWKGKELTWRPGLCKRWVVEAVDTHIL